MKYVLKPSLEHMALVTVAATLWNQDDLKNLLAEFYIPFNHKELNANWAKIEFLAIKKVAMLPLPKLIKRKILCFIKPIGFEILTWKQFHERDYNLSLDLPNEFCWTSQGTIDRKKTAEGMVKDQNIDINTRYNLACIYCFEDDIPKLFEEIPEGRRKSFYNQEELIEVRKKELLLLWTYQIQDEEDKMNSLIEKRMGRRCSLYQYGFEVAASNNNRVAAEYFLPKLTATERDESLVKTAMSVASTHFNFFNERPGFLKEIYCPILCFLFSELNEVQQIEVLQCRPLGFLTSFLNWPMQIFFMQTVNRMWNFLDRYSYVKLFCYIIGKVKYGYKDFNYQKLFREVWEQSPKSTKRCFLSQHHGNVPLIVSELLEIKDEDNIRLILKDSSRRVKMHLVYDRTVLDVCKNIMKDENQLSLLKCFIKECLLSKCEVIKYKGFVERNLHIDNFHNKFKILSMLDDIIYEFERRRSAADVQL